VFELGKDGKSYIKKGATCKGHEDKCKEAVEGCPVSAIKL
jgi:ferredoxin